MRKVKRFIYLSKEGPRGKYNFPDSFLWLFCFATLIDNREETVLGKLSFFGKNLF